MTRARTSPPRVWVVLSDKRGDNGQVHAVEAGLPWPCEQRFIAMREAYVFGKPRSGPTLYHIDRNRSDPLEPPWPDLILTSGRRCENVALWVREQSGGRTRIVVFGKPSAPMADFDLVIHSVENQIPPLTNVVSIGLPLMRVDPAAVAAAAEQWRARLEKLPRPLTALLIGGPTASFVYDRRTRERLLALAGRAVERGGGAYLVTSRRTPPALVDALASNLTAGMRLYRWSDTAGDNPYLGLLGLADDFIVTGDSISMMVEVAGLGKPLAILPLGVGWLGALDQLRRSGTRRLYAPAGNSWISRGRERSGIVLFRAGLLGVTRDFTACHRLLVEDGLAVWAGQDPRPPRGPIPDHVPEAVARIAALMDAPTG